MKDIEILKKWLKERERDLEHDRLIVDGLQNVQGGLQNVQGRQTNVEQRVEQVEERVEQVEQIAPRVLALETTVHDGRVSSLEADIYESFTHGWLKLPVAFAELMDRKPPGSADIQDPVREGHLAIIYWCAIMTHVEWPGQYKRAKRKHRPTKDGRVVEDFYASKTTDIYMLLEEEVRRGYGCPGFRIDQILKLKHKQSSTKPPGQKDIWVKSRSRQIDVIRHTPEEVIRHLPRHVFQEKYHRISYEETRLSDDNIRRLRGIFTDLA